MQKLENQQGDPSRFKVKKPQNRSKNSKPVALTTRLVVGLGLRHRLSRLG
jgi:hypothetical protein